jgi:hypothetical protein
MIPFGFVWPITLLAFATVMVGNIAVGLVALVRRAA